MANSPSESSTSIGEGETVPETVTKADMDALFRNLRSLEKEIKNLKAAKNDESESRSKAETAKHSPDSEKDEMKKQIKLLLDREKERETELSSQKMNSALREYLVSAGVDARHIDHALAYVNQKGLVRYDEDGALKMKVNQVDYDLQDGAKLWAKQDDAKLYLAPKGANGSGQKGPVTQSNQSVSNKATVESNFTELLKQLPGAMSGL